MALIKCKIFKYQENAKDFLSEELVEEKEWTELRKNKQGEEGTKGKLYN